jgi:serine/threonine-protein kinase
MADPLGAKLHAGRQAPRAPLWRRAVPYALTAIVVAAAAVAATVAVISPRATAPPIARFSIVLPDDQQFVNNARHLIDISPDGTNIVYAANQQLYLRRLGDVDARPIQDTAQSATRPFFSPDGRWIGYYSRAENKFKKIAITGGAAVTIGDSPDANSGFGPVWAADDYIYVGQPRRVARIAANGGALEPVIALKGNETAHRPQLLDDGDSILFTLATGISQWDASQIVIQSRKSGERTVLIPGGSDGRYLSTGHIMYVLGNNLLAVPFDLKTKRVGGPVPVVEGVRRATNAGGGGADGQYAVAANGTLVYVPGGARGGAELTLVLVDRLGVRKPLNVTPGARQPDPSRRSGSPRTAFRRERFSGMRTLVGRRPVVVLHQSSWRAWRGRQRRHFHALDGGRRFPAAARDQAAGDQFERLSGRPVDRVSSGLDLQG